MVGGGADGLSREKRRLRLPAQNVHLQESALHLDAGDIDGRVMSFYDHESALSNEVLFAVLVEVVADLGAFGDLHVLIQNGAFNFGVAAYIAVVEKDSLL